MKIFTKLLTAVCLIALLVLPAAAQDAAQPTPAALISPDQIDGIFICSVPAPEEGVLLLGERTIRSGDVLPKDSVEKLVLERITQEEADLTVGYMTIVEGKLQEQQQVTMHVQSTKDAPPVAEDTVLETYRDLPNSGVLPVTDEGGCLTYQVVRQPKYGTVALEDSGRFVYTPKKHKAGEDAFTYTATDEAGNVSNEATVRIRILQPIDKETFADMERSEQFAALWLRQTGLFGGERIMDRLCFCPEKTVTRGEFLCMAMRLAGIDPEVGLVTSGFDDQQDAPGWMQPYLVSAMRRGIVKGIPLEDALVFRPNQPVTQAEAAVMLSGALRLQSIQPAVQTDSAVPAWAQAAVSALSELGIGCAAPEAQLRRADAAELLYRAGQMKTAG